LETFISYSQWFNDNFMIISLSDKSIWKTVEIVGIVFTKLYHVMPG